MQGHVTGNLLIVSLWELMGDHVRALDWVGRLLGAHGRVLPMATTPMDISARVRGVDPDDPDGITVVRGQVQVATTEGQIESVALVPEDPEACAEAVDAIRAAECGAKNEADHQLDARARMPRDCANVRSCRQLGVRDQWKMPSCEIGSP